MPLTARRKSKLITMTLAVTGLGTLVALVCYPRPVVTS